MIPSFKPGIMSSNRIRAAGGGADVTPNAVNWNDVAAPGGSTNTVTITGINTAIDLSISWTGYPGVGAFRVYKNGSETQLPDYDSPFTLSVSNNDEIYFFASSAAVGSISVTVTNASDGNTVLDTFTINIGEEGGGGG